MSGFRHLDHISEAYIEAYGRNLEEAFENAGKGMFDVMTDVAKVEPKEAVDVEVEGEDKQSLLMEWLSELLFLFDTTGMVFSNFKVEIQRKPEGGFKLRAKAYGEAFNPEKHPARVEVKAVTYSLMEIKEEEGKATVRFVLDI